MVTLFCLFDSCTANYAAQVAPGERLQSPGNKPYPWPPVPPSPLSLLECTHMNRRSMHTRRKTLALIQDIHARMHMYMRTDTHSCKTYIQGLHTQTHTHSNYKKRTHNKTYALTFATEVPIKADTTSVFAIHSRIYNNNNKMYCDNSDCRV